MIGQEWRLCIYAIILMTVSLPSTHPDNKVILQN